MTIQLFSPKFHVEECLDEIRECLEKGWTGMGFKTVEFEDAWKQFTGLPHAHFLNSNTSGLHLAFEILKHRNSWQDNDEVLTTPLTFVSTNHAILQAGLSPVFVDVDEHLCLDPQDLERKITPRTRAVIFVGMGGNTGRYRDVVAFCQERGLKLILDAAHMAGTRYDGVHVGNEADAAVFSFQAVKNLPTADSGMICFADGENDILARRFTWLGISKDTYARTTTQGAYKWMYDVEHVGFKYHGNSIMAAIALVQLKYLDQDNAYRRQLASWYRKTLGGCTSVKLIPHPESCESAGHLFQVRVKNRDALMFALHEHDIYPGVHYRDNTEYPMYSYAHGTCPVAHAISKEILSLPLHLQLTKHDVTHIANLVEKYAG